MTEEIMYDHKIDGYRLRVVRAVALASNFYSVLLTNMHTGATQRSDGWRGYPDALIQAQHMLKQVR